VHFQRAASTFAEARRATSKTCKARTVSIELTMPELWSFVFEVVIAGERALKGSFLFGKSARGANYPVLSNSFSAHSSLMFPVIRQLVFQVAL